MKANLSAIRRIVASSAETKRGQPEVDVHDPAKVREIFMWMSNRMPETREDKESDG
jgi:hypothetical protein